MLKNIKNYMDKIRQKSLIISKLHNIIFKKFVDHVTHLWRMILQSYVAL